MDNYLVELYNGQALSTDALAGSEELTAITERLNGMVGAHFTTDEVLGKLVKLRKTGKLKRKTNKTEGRETKVAWPKAVDGVFRVDVVLSIDKECMCSAVESMGEVPVSRQEVFDYVRTYPSSINYQWVSEKTVKIVERLFPELRNDN